MSRIILDRYDDGQVRIVVGYDHPCNGAFWQHFNQEPGDGIFDETFEEVLRDGGIMYGIPLNQFRDQVPEDLRPLITDRVMQALREHAADPDSGYNARPIDFTRQ